MPPVEEDVVRSKELIPELSMITPLDNVNATEQIVRIESIEKELKFGSVDQWAARLLIAEFAWTIEGLDAKRLEALRVFGNGASLPMSEAALDCSPAELPALISNRKRL